MIRSLFLAAAVLAALPACTNTSAKQASVAMAVPDLGQGLAASGAPQGDDIGPLIAYFANRHDIPESLLNRVVKRESGFNPSARNGPYWGLMQIRHDTARTMGYDGPASGLLDARTNLEYAGRYLRGAWLLADGSESRAVTLYASGYYYVAKRRGMLCETRLRNCGG